MPAMTQVLIVDDNPDIRRLLAITLGEDCALDEATDGLGALESIRQFPPKVVLLDVMMLGELDGLQVLQAIKSNPQTNNIQVAMVSARGQIADSDQARQFGADAYFIKPFSPRQVSTWVRDRLT
jgi:CheY-like chemotaxis protein